MWTLTTPAMTTICARTTPADEGVCVYTDVACGDNVCDPATGECVECVADADCDDGLFCTGTETCVEAACVDGADPCDPVTEVCDEDADECVLLDPCAGVECDDGDLCTDDSCEDGICVNEAVDCDDGVFCNGVETCEAATGDCIDGDDPCDADTEYCDEDNDECTNLLPCTEDTECDDGLFCNGVETCEPYTGKLRGGHRSVRGRRDLRRD